MFVVVNDGQFGSCMRSLTTYLDAVAERWIGHSVPPAEQVLEESDWTPDGRSRALGLKGSAGQAAPCSQTFPMGGWTQLASPRAVVWFDHGPMGLPPMRVHGHADALSVWWLLDGQPMWVDAGTLRYLGRPAWRNWLRSPRAHNTLRLGHRDAVTP